MSIIQSDRTVAPNRHLQLQKSLSNNRSETWMRALLGMLILQSFLLLFQIRMKAQKLSWNKNSQQKIVLLPLTVATYVKILNKMQILMCQNINSMATKYFCIINTQVFDLSLLITLSLLAQPSETSWFLEDHPDLRGHFSTGHPQVWLQLLQLTKPQQHRARSRGACAEKTWTTKCAGGWQTSPLPDAGRFPTTRARCP